MNLDYLTVAVMGTLLAVIGYRIEQLIEKLDAVERHIWVLRERVGDMRDKLGTDSNDHV